MTIKRKFSIVGVIFAILMLLAWVEPAHPINQYLRDGAAGDGNGDDWTNAFEDMANIEWDPAGIERGDTLFVGPGTYTGDTFDLAEDAAKYVTILRATVANHGTDIGWVSGYADGAATFSATTNVWNIDTGYWIFDGATSAANDTTGHGFVVSATGTDQLVMTCADFTTANPDYITLKHTKFHLPNWDYSEHAYLIRNSGSVPGDGVGSGSQHITISYCLFEEAYQHINTLFCDEWIVEYSHFRRNRGNDAQITQTESWQAHGSDYMTIRYNVYADCCGTGIIALKNNFAYPFVGWEIHNNLFYWSPGDPFTVTNCQNGIITDVLDDDVPGNYVDSLRVYNNTFANMTGIPGVYLSRPAESHDNRVFNNIFFNPADASGPHLGVIADYNGYDFGDDGEANGVDLSTCPFADTTAVDFTQIVDALSIDEGTNLGSPYNVDILGVSRPQGVAWDLGAYELGGDGGEITVTSPNGDEEWIVSSSHDITWTYSNVANVKIDWSDDGGGAWVELAASTTAADGNWEWVIGAGDSTTNALVRISNAADGSDGNDTSDGNFDILPIPSVTILSPNGGESWVTTSAHSITWAYTQCTLLDIDLSRNNGSSWTSIATGVTAANGTWTWTVGAGDSTTQALIRITDTVEADGNDESNAIFTLLPFPSVTVLSPNGAESWNASSAHSITWAYTNCDSMRIEWSDDNGSSYSVLALSLDASLGTWTWTIGAGDSTLQAIVRITDPNEADANDISDAIFTILPFPDITITSPNGGESWTVGDIHNITWVYTNISNILIQYTSDGGGTWNTIVASQTTSTGSFAWTVPDDPSEQCVVLLTSTTDATDIDGSDDLFAIIIIAVTDEGTDPVAVGVIALTATGLIGVGLYSYRRYIGHKSARGTRGF